MMSTDVIPCVANNLNMFTDSNCNITSNNSNVMQQLALELSNISMMGLDDNHAALNNHGYHSDDSGGGGSRSRGSNMTECVPVPSSEHVAEIVGRQGCKIKALRAKTNTYIKTPVRGEEPVFVVTGRKEDVASAKREILSAAEHFSQIRASRRNSGVSLSNGNIAPGPPSPSAPGQVTIQVRVPYRVVGLVVGPKGATIKRIQQQTHTYIVTPSRDKEPVFEVTGLPENVESARLEIESHIAMRTGGAIDSQGYEQNDFHSNGVDLDLSNNCGDIFSNMYNPAQRSKSVFSAYNDDNTLNNKNHNNSSVFNFPSINTNTLNIGEFNPLSNGFTSAFSTFGDKPRCDNDEGLGSPTYDPLQSTSSIWPQDNSISSLFASDLTQRSSLTTPRLSPTITDTATDFYYNGTNLPDNSLTHNLTSDPLSTFGGIDSAFSPFANMNVFCAPTNSYGGAFSSSGSSPHTPASSNSPVNDSCSPTADSISPRRRNCIMCSESEIVAALVPCGHNYFCMDCAHLLVERPPAERLCPLCKGCVSQAIRIFS